LPLSVDIDLAEALAGEVAARCGGILCTGIAYGARSLPATGGGDAYPGSVHVRGTVLIEYLADVIGCYARMGVRRLVIVNGHYENESLALEAIEVCRVAGQLDAMRLLALSWWSAADDEFVRQLLPGPFYGWHAEHAGICETSLMMYLRPETVRKVRVDHDCPPTAGVYSHPVNLRASSTQGVLSQTSGSSVDLGRALFSHLVERLIELVRSHLSVDQEAF
jgi:creatinine amidohydrolase